MKEVEDKSDWRAAFPSARTSDGYADVRTLIDDALDVMSGAGSRRGGPVTPGGPSATDEFTRKTLPDPLLAETPAGTADERRARFRQLVESYVHWSVDVTHPATAARMQCPPTSVAVASETVTAALNQSLHAWEAGPFALALEKHVVATLAGLVGYGPGAGGSLTAGGSLSNLMGIQLARDDAIARRLGRERVGQGIAATGLRPVVLCTGAVHFSIGRGAAIAGIGEDSVVTVDSDRFGRMSPEGLDRALAGLPPDHLPVCVVVCAGATDLGWVDPLPELAAVARRHGVWLHADAAYGGGALFSDRLRHLLDGIAEADSVTLDLHKFGWVPASAGTFLVRDAEKLRYLECRTTMLNADDDARLGYYGLYTESLQATRRSDALKIAATLHTMGRAGMGAMVEACHDLAVHAADRVAAEPRLELVARPPLSAVLLRYLPRPSRRWPTADAFNSELRRRLMAEGRLMLARNTVAQEDGSTAVFMKLMLLNPTIGTGDVDASVDHVLAVAEQMEHEAEEDGGQAEDGAA
ncbi:aminotransferase class V-fold PLP-dependent enzyme [Streptomyces variabilis]